MARIILLDVDDVLLLPCVSAHEWYRAHEAGRPAVADVRVPRSAQPLDIHGSRSWFRPQVIAGLIEASRHARIVWSTSWLAFPNGLDELTDALGLRGHIEVPADLESLQPSRYGIDDTSRVHAAGHWKVRHARAWLDGGSEVLWLENQLNGLILGQTVWEPEKMRALHWVSPDGLTWTAPDGGPVGRPGLLASDMPKIVAWAKGDLASLRIQRGSGPRKMTNDRWESKIRRIFNSEGRKNS